MTTQREPDTSAEGRAWRYSINYGPDGEENYANVYTDNGELVGNLRIGFARKIVDGMNALAGAAGQAAPVPPPVEDETSTLLWSLNELAEALESGGGSVLRKTDSRKLRKAIAFIRTEHDRAEGLAKEVERLKEQSGKQVSLIVDLDAKLAVYEAPLVDAEVEALTGRLRNGLLASAGFVRDSKNAEAVSAMEMAINDVDSVGETFRRLSAAHAECKGENTKAATDVLAERKRQIEVEGWTAEHDDKHADGEIALAASAYAYATAGFDDRSRPYLQPGWWPWATTWFKPTSRRRDLVKAGALILAEIERLDRAALAPASGEKAT